jgi:hypothetical protein
MIDTLYISHGSYNWDLNNLHDIKFLNNKNVNKIMSSDIDHGNFYTSLEDLKIKIHDIDNLINASTNIVLVGIDQTLLNAIDSTNVPLYLTLLATLQSYPGKCKNIDQFNSLLDIAFNNHRNTRQTDEPTAWICGCSVTAGTGVLPKQRYANILSEKLNMPTVLLAEGGSSLGWQADQLLRADIRPNDIVIWGLTSITRINYFNNNTWTNCTVNAYLNIPKKFQYWNIDYFNSPTQAAGYVKNILQVENFCKKIGTKCYFINLFDSSYIPVLFHSRNNFLDLSSLHFNPDGTYKFLDFGNDNSHPGPIQHREYAEQIYNFVCSKS